MAVAALSLAGCATGPTVEELAAADAARCTSYGYSADHPDHGLCRMMLDQQRAQNAAAIAAARAANSGLPLAGAALLQQAIQPR